MPRQIRLLGVIGSLAMGGEVDALPLDFGGDPEADDQVDDLVEDQTDDAAPYDGDQDREDLGPDVAPHGFPGSERE